MKRILVMCKDKQQWVGFQDRMSYNVARSFLTRIELRGDSIILQEYDQDTVFILITPNMALHNVRWMSFDSIKWLCEESLFDKEIVDYLKGRIGE